MTNMPIKLGENECIFAAYIQPVEVCAACFGKCSVIQICPVVWGL